MSAICPLCGHGEYVIEDDARGSSYCEKHAIEV